jgi:hypothetical protein
MRGSSPRRFSVLVRDLESFKRVSMHVGDPEPVLSDSPDIRVGLGLAIRAIDFASGGEEAAKTCQPLVARWQLIENDHLDPELRIGEDSEQAHVPDLLHSESGSVSPTSWHEGQESPVGR